MNRMTAKDRLAQDPTVLDPARPARPARPAGPAATSAERLAGGDVVGDYVVERHIGAGAMGDVYAGLHPVIGKRVAIKVIKRELATRADSAERFLREARAVNQVDHPSVVDVFALGRLDDGRLYLVMDLLAGESLRERLRTGPLAPAIALAILGQVAEALDVAHGKGVVHRDLKPDNIVVTGPADRPAAHVLDFGIAKLLADASGARVVETLTGQGAWLGTPAYMAPEQWSADGASGASDRYALGIVAYELLTGKVPFRATTLPAMMEQHFRAAVPSVTASGTALSPALDRVFARALAKEPGDRHPTAVALVADLAEGLGGRGGHLPPRTGRMPWLAVGAAAVVVVVGGVVVVAGAGRTPALRAPTPGAGTVLVQVTTTPAGARVRRDGKDLGVTPLLVDAAPGEAVHLELSKPGYATVQRTAIASPGDPVAVAATLAAVAGFEGVWALPDGGFRAFERRGEQVAGFRLEVARGPRQFLRFFEFVPADDRGVAFTASEPHIDERAPDEPSCHLALHAEYHYDPVADALAIRKQRARYDLIDGRCVVDSIDWGEARTLARVAGASTRSTTAESRAGAGPVPVSGPGDDDKPAPPPSQKPTNGKQRPSKVAPNLPVDDDPAAGNLPGPPAANVAPASPNQADGPVPQAAPSQAQVDQEKAQAIQRVAPTPTRPPPSKK